MPLFDFRCPKCEYVSEELIQPGEEIEFNCPQCSSKMERDFPTNVSFRMTDNFIIGRERPTKEVEAKLEQYKEDPSKDPYKKFRGN